MTLQPVVCFSYASGDRVRIEPGLTYHAAQVGSDLRLVFSNFAELTIRNTQLGTLQSDWIGS